MLVKFPRKAVVIISHGFVLYYRKGSGDAKKTQYPHAMKVDSCETLAQAVLYDHVCAEFKNNTRSTTNFIQSNCLPMDSDNEPSDKNSADLPPEEWVSPDDVRKAFPGVTFFAVPSRNNMKQKDNSSPRPRYHYYFPIDTVTSAKKYAAMKAAVHRIFPAFDGNALDAARFLYGKENPKPEYYEGEMNLTAFLAAQRKTPAPKKVTKPLSEKSEKIILKGNRENAMFEEGTRIITRHGDTAEARSKYDDFVDRLEVIPGEADPPQPKADYVWKRIQDHYNTKTKKRDDYVSPLTYEAAQSGALELEPSDYTDVGQAVVLAREYGKIMRYSKATSWIVYTGKVWDESELKAHGLTQKLTTRQLKEARLLLNMARSVSDKAVENDDEGAGALAKDMENHAKKYRAFVLMRRKSSNISAAQTEAEPMSEIGVDELDSNPFLLNTQGGVFDFEAGKMRPHSSQYFCTKITSVSPSKKGMDLWLDFVDKITCGDKALAEYHQISAGMCAIGRVYQENLIIAHGGGRNGKSTFYNTIARVLGDYSGYLSAETLTINCRKNKSPEYAELRGRRIVIASELEEGTRLDTAIVKKLCSTDTIYAEKKYKQPFSYTPSHTVILFTNHLPSVGTYDDGTWGRLIVIPFNAFFVGADVILNYADYLYNHAGGAVLTWIIQGARKFINNSFKIEQPDVVKKAIAAYRRENDWIMSFVDECCDIGDDLREKSGKLYNEYKSFCFRTGAFQRKQPDFNKGMEAAGFKRTGNTKGYFFEGLKLPDDFLP